MKKILLMIMLLLTLTGCNNYLVNLSEEDQNNNKTNEEKSLLETMSNLGLIEKEFKCDVPLQNIKDIVNESEGVNNYFITIDNKLYQYSVEKLFSGTNNNCISVDTNEIEIVGFLNGHHAPADSRGEVFYDNKFIHKNDEYSLAYEKYNLEKNYPGYDIYFYGGSLGAYISKNNEIFKIENNNINKIKLDNNENITNIFQIHGFNNNESRSSLLLTTDSNFFSCEEQIINKEDCEKYEDVTCKKELVCNLMELSKYKSEIQFYNGNFLITKENKLYVK